MQAFGRKENVTLAFTQQLASWASDSCCVFHMHKAVKLRTGDREARNPCWAHLGGERPGNSNMNDKVPHFIWKGADDFKVIYTIPTTKKKKKKINIAILLVHFQLKYNGAQL